MPTRSIVPFKGQDYAALKRKAISTGRPFYDPEFPPNDRSLYCRRGLTADMVGMRPRVTDLVRRAVGDDIVWKRPKELVTNPRLCVEGVNTSDVVQGELGNCWLVAACACIAIHKSLWSRVVVDAREQEWNETNEHPGIFHFRFWRFGVWVDVVVDDCLPTRAGKLIYLRSPHRNEFWSALLEKAYAKLFGCYESLNGGELAEALEDFTGGVSESCNLMEEKQVGNSAKRREFFDWLLRAAEHNAVMCAAIPAKSEEEMEKPNKEGLVIGHAYSVTAVRKVHIAGTGLFGIIRREKLPMIRLRNPWGDSEWTGPFSDRSPEWKRVVKRDREKMGLTFDNDGEFWMTFDDFCKYFVNMAMCHHVNTSVVSVQKRWMETKLDGAWTIPKRAGGCSNNQATFFDNPQYVFEIHGDKDDVMFHLTQKTARAKGTEKLTIGFTIMKCQCQHLRRWHGVFLLAMLLLNVEHNRAYRIHSFQPIVGSSPYRNSRSVFWMHSFTRGRYILVATIFEPLTAGLFLLRVFAGHSIGFRELLFDQPPKPRGCLACCRSRYPKCVTRIRVCRAVGLKRKDGKTDVNPFCVISCEGQSVRGDVIKKTTNPEFNTSAVFYRKQPQKRPITVEIFHRSSPGIEEFLGGLTYGAANDTPAILVKLSLHAKLSSKSSKSSSLARVEVGRVLLEVTTSQELDSL